MRGPGHDMDANSSIHCLDQPLDDHRILVTLVLQPEGLLRPVDKGCNSLPTIVRAPDEPRFRVRLERLSRPIGIETSYHLRNFPLAGGHHRIVTGFREIPRLPIERFHKLIVSSIIMDF